MLYQLSYRGSQRRIVAALLGAFGARGPSFLGVYADRTERLTGRTSSAASSRLASGTDAAAAVPPAALRPPGEPPSESLVGELLREAVTASGETCLRLSEVQLEDRSPSCVRERRRHGRVRRRARRRDDRRVRSGSDDHRATPSPPGGCLTDEPDGDQTDWRLNRLTDVPGEERRAASADYLNDVIASGLSSITPVLSLASGSEARDAVLELNLHALCCLELFNHVAAANDFPRCANESCARLFVRDEQRPAARACATARGRARALRPSASSGGARPPRPSRRPRRTLGSQFGSLRACAGAR